MIDLHLHLDGSVAPQDIIKAAEESGIECGCKNIDEIRKKMVYCPNERSLVNYLSCFDIPCSIMQTPEIMRYMVLKLSERLYSLGIKYAEVRFAPQLHINRGFCMDEMVEACIEALEYSSLLGVDIKFILCMMRGEDKHKLNELTIDCAEKYLGKGVCAIDLAGDEAGYPTKNFEDLFKYASKHNIPFTIHAGEAGSTGDVWDAVRYGAKRIGHGIRLMDDIELIKYIKSHNIGIECCPTSNVQTGAVEDIYSHPLVKMLENGLLVNINSDNMTVSDTNIVKEYKIIEKIEGFNSDYKKVLLNNAKMMMFR